MMDSPDTLNPAANNPPASRPDEFNETAPVQPGTEVEPNAPAETPTAPTPTPPIPDTPLDSLQPDNREQDDEDAQAQTVAGDAMSSRANDPVAAKASQHGGTTNPAQIIPDDEQDVVDHMQQMERSGRIDMDAYRGERNDDDESGMLGEGGMEPGDLDEHGNAARETAGYTGVE
jgi:hypothetical protein